MSLIRMQTKQRDITINHCLPLTPTCKLLYQFMEQGLVNWDIPIMEAAANGLRSGEDTFRETSL